MVIGKDWTEKEEEYFKESWGKKSIFTIMKALKRSESALYTKAYKMGLGPFKDNLDGVTLNQLALALNKSVNCINNYIKLYGLPYETIQASSQKTIKYVNLGKWWRWLEKNHSKVDFTLFEKYALGPEPEWVERQRAADLYDVYKKNKYKEWTSYEIATLKKMLSEFKYTTEEIAKKLERSPTAILSKIRQLGILLRPIVKEAKKPYWTEEEISLLECMCDEDKPLKEISEVLNRSQSAIRTKIKRLKESNEKERNKMVENGEFIGHISMETCARLQVSKQSLQRIDASIKQKIGYYVSIGKTEADTNVLIADEFMESFCAEFERYGKIESEIRAMLSCSATDVFHINFETGAVIKIRPRITN